MKEILIATNSSDACNTDEVCKVLSEAGHEPIVYNADQVYAGEKRLSFSLSSESDVPLVTYDGHVISDETISAAWYWRPDTFCEPLEDKGLYLTLRREVLGLQGGVLDTVETERWLNAPDRMARAANKLRQLQIAREVGFQCPKTVVSNDWSEVSNLPSPLIAKMLLGYLYQNDQLKLMYTQVFSAGQLESYKNIALPFPAIYQAYIPKRREWRVTVVGDDVFSVAIYTAEEAKDDWRRPQEDPNAVRYSSEPVDSDIAEKCVAMLQRLGLNYGAFDLIEDPSGQCYFLEVNVNGQFRGFEIKTGMRVHISEAIAAKLLQIAAEHK